MTSISQAQFWRDVDVGQYGDGTVRGILSVDVSDWDTPGRRTGKVASRCSREEIRTEVWGQLVDHLNDGPHPVLDDSRVLAWFLDPAIEYPNPTEATNLEPLLINTAGSWSDRPEATTRIANLVLAADYVRTNNGSGDDGRSQRGCSPCRQRDSRCNRLISFPLCAVRSRRADGPAPRTPARPTALDACSIARPSHRCASSRTARYGPAVCSDALPSGWLREAEAKHRRSRRTRRRG